MEGYGQPGMYGGDPYAAQAYAAPPGMDAAYGGTVDPNVYSQQAAPPVTGDCFPYVSNHTISAVAEQRGRYPDPIAALAFDPIQELLYAGTTDGRITTFHSPSMERHAACAAHEPGVSSDGTLAIAPVGGMAGGCVSVSATRFACHSPGMVKRWSHDLGAEDPVNDPLTCCAVDPHAMGGVGRAYVGRVANQITQVDIATGTFINYLNTHARAISMTDVVFLSFMYSQGKSVSPRTSRGRRAAEGPQ